MALRDKLSTIKTDQLDDLYAVMAEADGLEADLATANATIGEKDKKIAELQDQANKLYARLILTETGTAEEEEKEETLDEFNERMQQLIVGK